MSILNVCTVFPQGFIKEHIQEARPGVLDTIIPLRSDDGNALGIPVSIVKGAGKGPTFTITAGIHGMEYPTIMSLVELRQEIDPMSLNGNLIILPIVNMPSFYDRVPFKNPMDGKNLNRVFPGNSGGSITEVMADFMTKELFPATDVLLDMHGGDVGEDLIPFICFYDNKDYRTEAALAARLSEVSGFGKIVVYPYALQPGQPTQYAFKQAVRQGVAALSIEIGKLGQLTAYEVKETKDAIYRMLSELKMYSSDVPHTKGGLKYFYKQSYIQVPVTGIFYSKVNAGDRVTAGMVLGVVRDVFGAELETITAKEPGLILYKIGTPPVNRGETLFCIARE